MKLYEWIVLVALLGLLALAACDSGSRGDGDDDDIADDDDAADDDDSADDDDDVLADDDDVLADDDDSAADDDDDTPAPTEGDAEIEGVWMVKYLDEQGYSHCEQAYEFQASAEFSPFAVGGNCTICTGEMVILNLMEISETHPAVTIPCVPEVHFTVSDNVGDLLTNPSTGFGDLIGDQALIDRQTAFDEGITIGSGPNTPTPQQVHSDLQGNGLSLTHIGYVNAPPKDSYFGMVGLHTVAVAPPGAPDYLPMWWYGTQVGEEVVMGGSYFMGSFWQINSNNSAADYATISFEGSVQATFTPPAEE